MAQEQQQATLLSVHMEGKPEMVIHVEPDGTAVVPVEMTQQDLAGGGSHRPGGVEWNTHESKVLLEHYVRYVPQVGPDKKFRSKKEMFKRIADQIFEATGQRRTGEQCENRYKTIMRRKRRHSDLPTLSTARFLLRSAIAADSDSHQMEEEEVEEEVMEDGEVRAEQLQVEEVGDQGGEEEEDGEDNEPQLLLELAAMGDEEHQLARRTSRRRAANSGLDQQQLLDRLQELHERRERRRDERERRRDLRHAEQMNLLRRILSVLERPVATATTTPTHVRVLSSSHR